MLTSMLFLHKMRQFEGSGASVAVEGPTIYFFLSVSFSFFVRLLRSMPYITGDQHKPIVSASNRCSQSGTGASTGHGQRDSRHEVVLHQYPEGDPPSILGSAGQKCLCKAKRGCTSTGLCHTRIAISMFLFCSFGHTDE